MWDMCIFLYVRVVDSILSLKAFVTVYLYKYQMYHVYVINN